MHERSTRWYLVGSAAVLAGAAYGILVGAWTFTIVMVLLGGMYFLLRKTPPLVHHIILTDKGYLLDNTFTSWMDCREFWLVPTPEYTELHIIKKQGWDKELVIQTDNIDPLEIKASVSQYLTERSDQTERLLDRIIRICKL